MLTVESLSCLRGDRTVIADLSFTVAAGEAVVLRGPNGVGKSTLLRALAGLIPSRGSIRWGNVLLEKDRAGYQATLLYAGHLDALKPGLDARDNLRFLAGLYGVAPQVDNALAALDLTPQAGTPAGMLSAGQKRRLGLARLALVNRPLWLLDEPTVSLDQLSSAIIARLAQSHCATGGAVIAATHIDLGIKDARTLTLTPAPVASPRHNPVLTGEAW